MTLRPKRLQALHDDVRGALTALELEADHPAHDGWLAPVALAQACRRDEPVLLRAALALGEAAERRTPPPAEPRWVRSDGGSALRIVPLRGDPRREKVRQATAAKVVLDRADELCCDAPKCDRRQVVGELWLELEGEATEGVPAAMLVGELLGDDDDVSRLGAAGHALAERLGVPFEGEASPLPELKHEPLGALVASRWSLRREGDHFVLRDHAQLGPREGVPREVLIFGMMVTAFAACWVGTYRAYVAGSWTTVAIFAATALVMTFFVLTMAQIVRHSLAYRGKSEALLWLARDQLVVAPWHDRDGAVDVGSAGRYGAAVRLGELDRVRLVEETGGWSLRCETAHGPFEIGVLEDRRQAELWQQVIEDLARAVAHQAPPRGARLGGRAPAAAALVLILVALLVPTGCAERLATPASPPSPAATPAATPAPTPTPSVTAPSDAATAAAPTPRTSAELALIEDDVPRAMAEAKESDKAVFVEVWAPWCHTCLSMKSFVLPDPALVPLREHVVFAAVDSDRPANADFMDRYEVNVWPTLFVIEPDEGEVVSMWQGAASVEELRGFLQDALDALDSKHDPQGPLAALLAAKNAHAGGRWPEAAKHYARALERGGKGWARRSEALAGLVFAEYRQAHWERCAQLGIDHAAEIDGAAVPADFSWVVLDCADEVKAAPLRDGARRAVLARLKRHTESPPAEASVDDRSDALRIYAGALADAGDEAGARAARQTQLALLEAAAKKAPGPEEASTFDYARMGAYLALGRGSEAVTLFRLRRQQLPDSYEPPARLAQTSIALGHPDQAVEPLEDAVAKAYGPRKMLYLGMLAEVKDRLADREGRIAALRRLLDVYDSLSDKQRGERRHAEKAEAARKALLALGIRR